MKWKIILLLLLIIPVVHAKSDSMKLLTITGDNESKGGIANVLLEVRPGKGNIFIDSFPLSKLDTQISTRYANQIACDFLNENCNKYDFFYTIRAKASIVGGPSAGGAITILTISVLSNLKLDKNTIMTGTINSGGLIGPVAGLDKKIKAAVDNGLTTILIPDWQSDLNLTEIQKLNPEDKVQIIKIKNIEEALYYFTGKNFITKEKEPVVSKLYSQRMSEVSNILCNRSLEIDSLITDKNNELYNISKNFINKSKVANSNKDYYSKGSFCFSANLRLRELDYQNKDQGTLKKIYNNISDELISFKEEINKKPLNTISDLEAKIIVIERLKEAQDYLVDMNISNLSSRRIAYSQERLFSAKTWSKFFDLEGKHLELDKNHLEMVCLKKISEAQERINYAEIYIPDFVGKIKKDLLDAIKNHESEEYTQCIFKASKSKAEANILLIMLTIKQDDLNNVILEKFKTIKKIINKLEPQNIFPIIGYSYYEYANSLKDTDAISSLTFAEYSLELSRLDFYFPTNSKFSLYISTETAFIFSFGFVLGISVCFLIYLRVQNKKKYNKRRRNIKKNIKK